MRSRSESCWATSRSAAGRWLGASLALLAAGCGTSGGSQVVADGGVGPLVADAGVTSGDAESTTATTAAPGQLAIAVSESVLFKTRADATGPWTTTIVFVAVTLSNGAGSPEVPTSPTLFTIKTASGLVKTAVDGETAFGSPAYQASAMLGVAACDPTLFLSAGAKLTCAVGATFDGDLGVVSIEYQTPAALASPNGLATPGADVRTAVAGLVPTACAPCGTLCTNTLFDPANCGSCGAGVAEGQRCTGGSPACVSPELTACGRDCVNVLTDTANCGACGAWIFGDGQCVGGQPVCPSGSGLTSSEVDGGSEHSGCVNLATDPTNCGSVGHACATVSPVGQLTSCIGGECGGRLAATGTDCNAACATLGLVCSTTFGGTVVVCTETESGACDEPLSETVGCSVHCGCATP